MLNPKKYKFFNEVIANFMELQKEGEKWLSPINSSKVVNLKYQESWDWLMPVIEKLRKFDSEFYSIEFPFSGNECFIITREDFPNIKETFTVNEPTWILECYAKCYYLIKYINGIRNN